MIRAENTLAAITKKDPGMKIKGEGYKGILVTENKLSGEVSRMELARLNSKTRIPEWVATKKYCTLNVLSTVSIPDSSSSLAFFLAELPIPDEGFSSRECASRSSRKRLNV